MELQNRTCSLILNDNIEPIWKDNYCAIAVSSSNEYVPYLSVCLISLKAHSNSHNNYDIIIFERDISEENKFKIKSLIEEKNISVRFVNPMPIISKYDLKYPQHYGLECYFRLTAPLVLKNFKKIIYTDIDLVFMVDIDELYSQSIEEYPLGACHDIIYNTFLDDKSLDYFEYATKELELKEPYKYFNTGVMLLNLEYMRENNISKHLLKMANNKQYKILEQDILNKYFKTNIKYLDYKWNFPTLSDLYRKRLEKSQEFTKKLYNKVQQNPAIIHWAGGAKPWKYRNTDYSFLWWDYAQKTPFYEVIIQRNLNFEFSEELKKYKKITNNLKTKINNLIYLVNYKDNLRKYRKYRFLINFSFGKTKERYKNKKNMYKRYLQIAEKLLRSANG